MDAPRLRPPRDPAAPLSGATIVVGVAGGIAAYKACELVRLLTKAGAQVHVCMTRRAQKFVGPMTFQALTGHPVFTDLFSLTEEATIGHIQLADRADLMIIAPATANAIARLAAGMADDAVTTVALAHPLTRANVARLTEVAGARVVGPDAGFLACRWTGPGRLAEPADIVEAAARILAPQDLAGKRVLVTAGPTHEAIDPARYLGNRSTGKMGYALAAAAARRGAEVVLVSGPVALEPPPGVEVVAVEDARAMRAALDARVLAQDLIVMAAAVADFRPVAPSDRKLKRTEIGYTPTIALASNPDILGEIGQARKARGAARPVLVGFAAETHDVVDYARAKLASKAVDMIVANDVTEAGAGFGTDTNRVVLVEPGGDTAIPAGTKAAVAHRILDRAVALLRQ